MHCNYNYQAMLSKIHSCGEKQICRNYKTIELLSNSSYIHMNQSLITLTERKLGYRFACAEAAWILDGGNRVTTMKPFSKIIHKFSDDGVFFFGAYGPKIIDQLEYIGRCFKKDLFSRQAVVNIWREKPPISNDIPCTLSLQFLIRMRHEKLSLYIIDNMRSSDAWLGVPYDWFSLSMVGAYVAIYIRNLLKIDLNLGILYMNAGSQHLYEGGFGYKYNDVIDLISDDKTLFEYEPLDINEFNEPIELVHHLWSLAKTSTGIHYINKNTKWLNELAEYWETKK